MVERRDDELLDAGMAADQPGGEPLTQLPCWVVWKWEQRKSKGADKWTKPPYWANDPDRPAKSNDPSTWGSYAAAIHAFSSGACDGIGFMLRDAQIGAGDLDHVRDPASGTLLTWAEQLVFEANEAGAYVELTVSGTGLRFIGIAHGAEIHRKFTFDRKTGAGIELYRNCTRYITVSGLGSVKNCPNMQVIDPLIDRLFERYGAPPPDQYDFNSAAAQSGSLD
jgi:primase-polymerase (primpol)-like protein